MPNTQKFNLIHQEVDRRFQPKIQHLQLPFQGGDGFDKLQNWIDNLQNIEVAMKDLEDTINEVIAEPEFQLTENEVEEFKVYIRPIVQEQLKNFATL